MKICSPRGLFATIVVATFAAGVLAGCHSAPEEKPYMGQPGDKLPQASGMVPAAGNPAPANASKPASGTKPSAD